MLRIRREVTPFIGVAAILALGIGFFLNAPLPALGVFLLGSFYLLFFFRDPDRTSPEDPTAILSGADGRVLSVTRQTENRYLNTECVRISIFLSIFDVHVNRAPLSGRSKFLGFFPGKKLAAFREKSAEFNQHNKILIEGMQTRCLIVQIAGILARRVVYWLDQETPVPVIAGDRIGMMKFGSRLDIYLPDSDVNVLVQPGDRVRAGETIVARIQPRNPGQNDFLNDTEEQIMPTYEYECESCGLTFERHQGMTENPLTECPECRGKVRRLIGGGTGFILKGSSHGRTGQNNSQACSLERTGRTCCGREERCGKPACGG